VKKALFATITLVLIGMTVVSGHAQLINYGRRSKFLRSTNPNMSDEDAIPQWAKELPEPQNAEEESFDINRDGKLQSAEVKVYLRGIMKRVEARSYVNVTTDILREYDKNKDGVINVSELALMREHVK